MGSFLIEIKNATVYLKGSKILSSISWTMRPNENWAVIGTNGAGKTTLMKLLFGELIPAFGGTVFWFGEREHRGLREIRENIGFVSAEYQAHYDQNITGLEVAASGFFSSVGLYDPVTQQQRDAAFDWLSFLGIKHLADKLFFRMSYGESRRVLLARALVNQPSLLVLDEPCSGLDIPTKELVLETIEKLSQTDTKLVYVTHHVEEIMPSITHVLYLKSGVIHLQGKKEDMLTGDVISQVLDCEITLQKNSQRYWITGCNIK
ncbi:MAG: ABC transporter ATP-binding protein [Nitrospinales bacterium]